jgi:hypothetical protein
MYLRFAVPSDPFRPERRTAAGIFHATYRLAYEGRFDEGERVWFHEEMEWFDRWLPATRSLGDWRAVCWFRGDAGEALSRIWRIVGLVEREGVPVCVYRTMKPGVVIYEDKFQVAAVPWRDTFVRAALMV